MHNNYLYACSKALARKYQTYHELPSSSLCLINKKSHYLHLFCVWISLKLKSVRNFGSHRYTFIFQCVLYLEQHRNQSINILLLFIYFSSETIIVISIYDNFEQNECIVVSQLNEVSDFPMHGRMVIILPVCLNHLQFWDVKRHSFTHNTQLLCT